MSRKRPPEMVACSRFSKHRDRFELAASAKHQRGQFEEDGLVIVDVGRYSTLP
jgi:hypothetical protein